MKEGIKRNHFFMALCAGIVVCAIVFGLYKSGLIFKTSTPLSAPFITQAKQGDTFFFGEYEQDNNLENGTEDIEWVVIHKADNSILALSKYCLDCKPYNDVEEAAATDWERCTLRKWLNEDFYNSAFSDDEKRLIASVNLQNPDSPFFKLPGGNNTLDNVFLLSCGDLSSFVDGYEFSLGVHTVQGDGNEGDRALSMTTGGSKDDKFLKTTYTEYAKERYIPTFAEQAMSVSSIEEAKESYKKDESEHGNNASMWWLRTPGDQFWATEYVNFNGRQGDWGSHYGYIGVRPAIVVSQKVKEGTEDGMLSDDVLSELNSEGELRVRSPRQLVYGEQQVHIVDKEGDVTRWSYSGLHTYDELSNISKVVVSDSVVVGLTNDGKVKLSSEAKELYGVDELPFNDAVDICICPEAIHTDDSLGDSGYRGAILALTSDGVVHIKYAGAEGLTYVPNVQSISANRNAVVTVQKDGSIGGVEWGSTLDAAEISGWAHISQVVCGENFVAGLKDDGTVVVSGSYLTPRLDKSLLLLYEEDWTSSEPRIGSKFDLAGWNNIVSIAAGESHLVGLRADGTVVSAGLNTYGQCDTSDWSDITSIDASGNVTIGYRSDGSYFLSGKEILENILALQGKSDVEIGYTY